VFVEQNRKIADCIGRSLSAFGCADRAELIVDDAVAYLATARESFDLVFCDPPYAFALTPDLPSRIFHGGLVRRDGYLLVEHADDLHYASGPGFKAGPEKKFGRTLVTFFQPVSPEDPS